MLLIIIIPIILLAAYLVLMIAYCIGWQRQKDFVLPANYTPHTFISIIIPARNEEQNIKNCLDAILAQHYPEELYEVIVVDDHSTDRTAAIASGYNNPNVQCINLAAYLNKNEEIIAYKKKAIATGIAHSKGELIVTTDADCVAGAEWLMNIAAIYEQQKPAMIVAPVKFTTNNSIVENFQLLDFMSMQGITVSSLQLNLGSMSNGANLAFSRAAYDAVNGYAGVDHLASGDDYLLMVKMKKAYPQGIVYSKSQQAIVSTPPQPDRKSFFQQRVRWASKSGKYDDKKMTAILSMVYLFNLSFLFLLIESIFYHQLLLIALGMLVVKTVIELLYLAPVARFYGSSRYLWVFPLLQPLHIAYIISAGFMGSIGSYEWKGRKTH